MIEDVTRALLLFSYCFVAASLIVGLYMVAFHVDLWLSRRRQQRRRRFKERS
jgi:hypothetical protein